MPLFNNFVLNVDLKRQVTAKDRSNGQITFAQAESAVLIFKVFDNGLPYDYSTATKAKIYIKTPAGHHIDTDAEIINFENGKAIKYEFEKISTVEIGFSQVVLAIFEDDYVVNIQPFNVYIYDNLQGGAGSYLELIKDLMDIIDELNLDLNNTIKLIEKGQPDGVASLDKDGKIPFIQMPTQIQNFIDHITHTVFKDQVHGMIISEDGILQYKTPLGLQNAGFAPDALGIGGGNSVLNASVTVANGVATVLYTGIPTVVAQKFAEDDRNLAYFTLNGTTFNGVNFNVTKVGLHTLWYRDSNGNTYTTLFNVKASQLPVTEVNIKVESGIAEFTISQPTSIVKWDKGVRDVPYFAYNGTVVNGNSFQVNEIGSYTLYYKLTNGTEFVKVFDVTLAMLRQPVISVAVKDGIATIGYTPTNYVIQFRKYAAGGGTDTLEYFRTGGYEYSGNTTTILSTGKYSFYHKYTNGLEAITSINVTDSMLPAKDTTPPTITITALQITASLYALTARATDSESGVRSIESPDGTVLNDFEIQQYATMNGTYTFKATDNAGNVATKSYVLTQINEVPKKIYGININTNNSNPSTAVTYTDDASAMTAGTSWDTVYPFNQIKPVLLNSSGVETAELDPNNYAKKRDGGTANITSGDNVMIKIPKVWYKMSTSGNTLSIKLATYAVDSTYKCYAHSNGTIEKDAFYIGAYLGYNNSGKLKSWSGKTPTNKLKPQDSRVYARANGNGYNVLGFQQLTLLQILQLLRSKTLYSQEFYGSGIVQSSGSTPKTTGLTNTLGLNRTRPNAFDEQVKIMGIEDFYGNIFTLVEGVIISGSRIKTTYNPDEFGNFDKHVDRGAYSLPSNKVGGYISKVTGTTDGGFLPKELNGSTDTYFADYAYSVNPETPYYRQLTYGGGVFGSFASSQIPLTGAYVMNMDIVEDKEDVNNGARLMYL